MTAGDQNITSDSLTNTICLMKLKYLSLCPTPKERHKQGSIEREFQRFDLTMLKVLLQAVAKPSSREMELATGFPIPNLSGHSSSGKVSWKILPILLLLFPLPRDHPVPGHRVYLDPQSWYRSAWTQSRPSLGLVDAAGAAPFLALIHPSHHFCSAQPLIPSHFHGHLPGLAGIH